MICMAVTWQCQRNGVRGFSWTSGAEGWSEWGMHRVGKREDSMVNRRMEAGSVGKDTKAAQERKQWLEKMRRF